MFENVSTRYKHAIKPSSSYRDEFPFSNSLFLNWLPGAFQQEFVSAWKTWQ